ncbi:MAG: tetratricopeptide repeat protein [Planctomycetaceae bacterium]|nr:tetratricopeptide repeat protein [Planctomycetaceae bacterium]
MAKKVNKKLVFVVGSLALVVVIGGVATLAVRYQFDAERNVSAGDGFMAAGDYKKAADAYGRAVNKKPNNLGYLDKLEDSVRKTVPATASEAIESHSRLIAVLNAQAKVARNDIGRWRESLEIMREQSEAADTVNAWKSLADRATDMLGILPPEDPCVAIANLYRGYALARVSSALNESERENTVKDLEAAATGAALTPVEKDMAYGTIARLAVADYARARAVGRGDRTDATRAAADRAIATADQQVPGGLRTMFAKLERKLVDIRAGDEGSVTDTLQQVADAAVALDDGTTLLESADVLAKAGRDGSNASIAMLRSYLAKHPDEFRHRRALAWLVGRTDPQAALPEIEMVVSAKRPATGLLSAIYDAATTDAAMLRFDFLYSSYQTAPAEERKTRREAVDAARADLAKLLAGNPDNSALLRTDAKLLLADGKASEALIKINEIFAKGSQIDIELYLLGAEANSRAGETGRSIELIEQGLQRAPGNAGLLALRADLEFRAGRYRQSLATAEAVLSVLPDNEQMRMVADESRRMLAADPTELAADDPIVEFGARIQQMVDAKEFDKARRAYREYLAAVKNEDVRMARMATGIELQAGDYETGRKLIDEYLTKFPADPVLSRFKAVISSDDPVERIVALTESTQGADGAGASSPVAVYIRLKQAARLLDEQATREERLGLATASNSRATARRVADGAAEWKSKAEAADRSNPTLLEAQFLDAIDNKDFAAAEAVSKLAEASSPDRTQAVTMRARALLVQGKATEATAMLEAAIRTGVDASTVLRTLGATLEQAGNLEGALRQYEDAYRRRPSDMTTVRLLVGALMRSGNSQRALEVLREARTVAGLDEEIGETWVGLESRIGDRRLAQRMRENRYRVAPADTTNAIALANIYAIAAPDREDVITERGEVAYNESQWRALDAAARNAAVDRTRETWRRRAEDILKDVTRRDPGSIDTGIAYSNLMRILGRTAEAEAVLAAAVNAAGDAAGWRGYAVLGQVQVVLDKSEAAKASFAEAVRREDPATREATKAIVDGLMQIERFALALPYLESVAASANDAPTVMRLAECQMRLGKIAEARASFDRAVKTMKERDLSTELLDGAISVANGDALRVQGDVARAKASYEAAVEPYQRAKQLAPSLPVPFVQDAMLKRKLFELTGERSRAAEALAVADRAVAVGSNYYPASAARSEVLIATGDLNGAIAELERFLRVAPATVDARRRVVELLMQTGNAARAEESLRAAIGYAPGESGWHYMLGDMLSRQRKFAEAAVAFERCDTLRPDPAAFLAELAARINAKDYRGVVSASRRRSDFMRTSGTARAYVGVALVAAGEASDGVKTLSECYAEARKAYDAGDSTPLFEWYGPVDLLYPPTRFAEAEALVAKIAGANPTALDHEYLASLAMMNPAVGPAKSIALLEKYATADFSKTPDVGVAVFERLGTAYYLHNECPKGIEMLEKALQLAPQAHAILNNYAYLCVECLKDAKKGLPSARLAVQMQPMRPEYLDTLGALLIADNQSREALEVLDRAATLGTSAPIEAHRAQALNALGRGKEAKDALAKADALSPDPATKRLIEQLKSEVK